VQIALFDRSDTVNLRAKFEQLPTEVCDAFFGSITADLFDEKDKYDQLVLGDG
jgi:hypothetical protein